MAPTNSSAHDYVDTTQYETATIATQNASRQAPAYLFSVHEHPYVSELAARMIGSSLAALQNADTATDPANPSTPMLYRQLFDANHYQPTKLVAPPYPAAELDFDPDSPYGVYNWELFFHLPLTVAIHLSRNQRYEQAQQWLQFIFDPTDDSDGPTPQRFWKFRYFQTTDIALIEELLVNLATGADADLKQRTVRAILAWQKQPFSAHAVARTRPSAYMLKTVMAYLDNLLAWGDSLFAQDTGESINEATQLYVLAANLLGPRPQAVPRTGTVAVQSYADLRGQLDEFGNALRAVEADIPFDLTDQPAALGTDDRAGTLRGLGSRALYFCIPRNDNLLNYWDTVADRLFNIRNSLNLQGVFRQVALFEPPIDPALLASAASTGVDVSAVVSGLNQPMPLVRYGLLSAKATEICHEVQSLGAQLLSALEKQDGEALALLRHRHESVMLGLTKSVRYAQWQETAKQRQGVERSLANSVQRYRYYQMLLGTKPEDIVVPTLDPLDLDQLNIESYSQAEPTIDPRKLTITVAEDPQQLGGGHRLNAGEVEELDQLKQARDWTEGAAAAEGLASMLRIIPAFAVLASPFGVGGEVQISGEQLSAISSAAAVGARQVAYDRTHDAGRAGKLSGYDRREQDWTLQSNLAAGEIASTFTSLRAAQLRDAIAEREWHNSETQIEHAEEIERFLTDDNTGKRTNQDFYTWLTREARGLYGQCFQFAFDVARKAERALQYEIGDPDQHFLQTTYLVGKEGLLAGEKLALDLKRMEIAYSEVNHREYELTKHVSLRQVDPRALLQLRATGNCTVNLPEEVFDIDGPGHYFRRIKTIAVSIPCIVGPYAGVTCTLTQLRSAIRTSPPCNTYPRTGEDSSRFRDSFGGTESIATSSGQNDAGLFETNLRDERYLPFEGTGTISRWNIELPAAVGANAVPQFDLDTIADVILHIRYTAREGGQALRDAALQNLRQRINVAETIGSVVLLSARHDFPTEWARFTSTQLGAETHVAQLTVPLREEHYPFWSRTVSRTVRSIDVYAEPGPTTAASVAMFNASGTAAGTLSRPTDNSFGSLLAGVLGTTLPTQPSPVGPLTIGMDSNSLTDVWIAIRWGAPAPH